MKQEVTSSKHLVSSTAIIRFTAYHSLQNKTSPLSLNAIMLDLCSLTDGQRVVAWIRTKQAESVDDDGQNNYSDERC
jgi:hypothetical protein